MGRSPEWARIEITQITLKERQAEKTILSKSDLESLRKDNDQQNRFYFVFKRLNLAYKDMSIEVDFKFSSARGIVEDSADIEINKDHFVKFQLLGV